MLLEASLIFQNAAKSFTRFYGLFRTISLITLVEHCCSALNERINKMLGGFGVLETSVNEI